VQRGLGTGVELVEFEEINRLEHLVCHALDPLRQVEGHLFSGYQMNELAP